MDIGIFGAGSFGQKHINVIKQNPEFNIIGFFEPNQKKSAEIIKKYNIDNYQKEEELISKCDAIDITCSTDQHYKMICLGMDFNKHIFVEKPICTSKEEIDLLIKRYENYSQIIQVGHIERYNPTLTNEIQNLNNISFIKSERNGTLNHRNITTPITLDLMIHDIDLITHLMRSKVIKITAEGSEHDVSCQLLFQNNKKAHLTSKRATSITNRRTLTINHTKGEIEIDLMNKSRKHTNLKREVKEWRPQSETNQLAEELVDFKNNVQLNKRPNVDLKVGCQSLEIALKINNLLKI